ncbi:MAG TPA: XRE family transcriptional regulator [Bacteroidetes bacterium]|nr:anaerobic benzoate catabolism transcriptional regulator [bacterium BMS3Bbin04]HDO65543.1 XRE family transcriptional regulator [Bacteroidota bacterium]HEX04668.1 XRE family transcriptional regulator [Bacteroidota bacterium]
MAYIIDFSVAASGQIETAICKRLEAIRLSRNITQEQLAQEAGVSVRTIGRLEKGEGVSLDTFIRVLKALRIQQNLEALLPDPTVRPMERIERGDMVRKRARPTSKPPKRVQWTWGDGGDDNEQ